MGSTVGAHADIQLALLAEQWQLGEFVELFSLRGVDYGRPVYPEWSARDVLAHIVFWHESFARNIEALGLGLRPSPPPWSLRETNRVSVEENRGVTKAALLRRLRAAQATIEQHVFDDSIGLIPYRRGSRPYGRLEHLQVVRGHIRDHHWHVVRALASGAVV